MKHTPTIVLVLASSCAALACSGGGSLEGGNNPPGMSLDLNSIEPNAGSSLGGTEVEISGRGFRSGATVVLVGNTAVETVEVVDDTTLRFTTPPAAPGTYSVAVYNEAGFGDSPNAFTYVPTPQIDAVEPRILNEGTNVTIRGRGFLENDAGAVEINIGEVGTCDDIIVVDNEEIQCTATRTNAQGSYAPSTVQVSNANGSAHFDFVAFHGDGLFLNTGRNAPVQALYFLDPEQDPAELHFVTTLPEFLSTFVRHGDGNFYGFLRNTGELARCSFFPPTCEPLEPSVPTTLTALASNGTELLALSRTSSEIPEIFAVRLTGGTVFNPISFQVSPDVNLPRSHGLTFLDKDSVSIVSREFEPLVRADIANGTMEVEFDLDESSFQGAGITNTALYNGKLFALVRSPHGQPPSPGGGGSSANFPTVLVEIDLATGSFTDLLDIPFAMHGIASTKVEVQ